VVAGEDTAPIDGEAWELTRSGSSGQNDPSRLHLAPVAKGHALWPQQAGPGSGHGHAVLLQQAQEVAVGLGHRPLLGLLESVPYRVGWLAEESPALGGGKGASPLQQGLGGYASPVEADAPHLPFLHQQRA
jgi:hypothetical protein